VFIIDIRKHGMKIGELLFDICNKGPPLPVSLEQGCQSQMDGGPAGLDSDICGLDCLLTELPKRSFGYELRRHFGDFGVSNASSCTMIT
jgi:hypothetical protein